MKSAAEFMGGINIWQDFYFLTPVFYTSANTACEYSVELFCILCLNALKSLEYLNWQGLKIRLYDKLL